MTAIEEKAQRLKQTLLETESAAVAFSAGVDSTLLLDMAHEALGDKVVAVTVRSVFVPQREIVQAQDFCASRGIRHVVLDADVLAVDGVRENPPERCYLCKRALFSMILRTARELGLRCVAEGSNADDLRDYRPGMRALRELSVRSPLLETLWTKSEIRELSGMRGLPTWDKPAMACLATRFVCGETLTPERLAAVEQAEELLRSFGFQTVRVRVHGDLARIELDASAQQALLRQETARTVRETVHALGFRYVALDLDGYRTGSMNAGSGV